MRTESALVVARMALAGLLAIGSVCALAQSENRGPSVGSITPIYGQLVRLSYPAGFKHAFAKDSGTFYIQESVLSGETVHAWSQMVTVTGVKGLASNSAVTPQQLAQQIASRFQQACPQTFAAAAIVTLKISGHDAFVALIGCGEAKVGPPRSEIAMIVTIRGESDYYSIQWAERGKAQSQAPVFNGDEWLSRLKQLQPILLCARIPGEPAPYPSCVDKKG